MAYTNAWSDTIPADSAAANTVGAQLRQLRLDLHQRMNTILGYPIAQALADPILPAYVPELDIPVWNMQFSSTAGTLKPPTVNTAAGIDVVQATHTVGWFFFGLILPIGVTMMDININVNVVGGTLSYDGYVGSRAYNASTITTLSHFSGAGIGVGAQNLMSVAQNGTVTAGSTYYTVGFSITPSAGATTTVMGANCLYTRPNNGCVI